MRPLLCLSLFPVLLACHPAEGEGPPDTAPPDDTDTALCGHLDIAMIYVPPGSFTMGTPPEEPGRDEDEEQHGVTLTHGFCISQHEIMQDSWARYTGTHINTHNDCGGECPADTISWHQAAWGTNQISNALGLERCYDCSSQGSSAFCETKGSPYNCEGFRLPTEAEWEYAARAGEVSAYPNGGTLEDGDQDSCDGGLVLDNGGRLDDVAWYCGNAGGSTHPVAQTISNPLFLYDVVGNIAEWVHDWYTESYGGSAVDPFGPSTGSWRVIRGGAYDSDPAAIRLGSRAWGTPHDVSERAGLRVVRTWDR